MQSKYVLALSRLKRRLVEKYYKKNKNCQYGNPSLGRGYLEFIQYGEGNIAVAGWLFNANHPFDTFVIKVNDESCAEVAPIIREDVASAFSFMDNALMSGFSFCVPLVEELADIWTSIEIAGMHTGVELGHIKTLYRRDFHALIPEPPVNLRKRVTNIEDPSAYWNSALKSYGEFFSILKEYRELQSINRLLDWGCGCGRLASLFMKHSSIKEIYGCDIDKEAMEWCCENLKKGNFSVINPLPPTHYEDSMFDVVIGYSVFTHLIRDVQIQWLREIRRIIRPGGLFIVSIHGEFASNFVSSIIRKEIDREGISDYKADSNLDGVAPAGYYRAVFQSKSYTQYEWGKYFDILRHIEGGVSNYQDLIIMQKK